MPRPRKIIETTDPLGAKINEVLAEKGMAGDYRALGAAFGVTTPSAREWVQFGRLSKERYRALVEWSGRPLDWWFDIPEHLRVPRPSPEASPEPLFAQEPTNPWRGSWPFKTLRPDELRQLPAQALREIEAFARGVMSQHPPAKSNAV